MTHAPVLPPLKHIAPPPLRPPQLHPLVQVDIASQAYLLSPGDHFFVPQHTTYMLSNHSSNAQAEVAFTVIKPSVGSDAVQ